MGKGQQFRGGLGELIRQARRVREKLEGIKADLKNVEEAVSVGDGKVVVTATGDRRVKSVRIDPKLLREEDLAMVEDLVTSAVNSVLEKVDRLLQKETEKVTGGVDIPGLF